MKYVGQTGDSTLDRDNTPPSIDTQSPALAQSMPVSSTDVAINPVPQGFDQPSIGAWNKPWTKDLMSGLRDFGYGAASGYATMGSAGDPTYVHPSGVETGPEHTENPFLGFLPTTPYDIGEFVGLAGPISGIAKGVGAVGKKVIPKVAQWAMQHSPTARFLGQRLSESVTGGTFSTAHQAATKGHVDPKEVAASALIFPALGTGGKLVAKTGGTVKRGMGAKPLSRLITGGEEVPVVGQKIKPEKPYFNMNRAKRLIATNYSKRTNAQLQKDYVTLRDYERFANNTGNPHHRKQLLEAGYFNEVADPYASGLVPKDALMPQNLRHALNEATAERTKRINKQKPLPKAEPKPGLRSQSVTTKAKEPWEMTQQEFGFSDISGGSDLMTKALNMVPGSKYKAKGDYSGLTPEQVKLIKRGEALLAEHTQNRKALYEEAKAEISKNPRSKKLIDRGYPISSDYVHEYSVKRAIQQGKISSHSDYPELTPSGQISGQNVRKPLTARQKGKVVPKSESVVPETVSPKLKVSPVPLNKKTGVKETLSTDAKKAETGIVEPPKPPVTKQPKPTEPIPEKTIGLNKPEIERIRDLTGLDKLKPEESRKWEGVLDRAERDGYDKKASEVAREVLDKKTRRPITDIEHAGMVLETARLADVYDAHIKTVNNLIKKGDTKAATLERSRAEGVLEQIDNLTDATKLGRREVARSLSIGRMMVNREDFSLAKVMQRAQASKGKKLSPKETAKIEKIVAEHDKLQSQVKDLETKYEKVLAEKEKIEAGKITNGEVRKARIAKKTATLKEKIRAERESIKKEIAELGYQVNLGVDPKGAYLIGKLAVNYIKEGAVSLEQVVKKVKGDIPELTEREIYQSLISKSPRAQKRARAAALRQIAQLKTQARLLLEIEQAQRGIFETPKQKSPQQGKTAKLSKTLHELKTVDRLTKEVAEAEKGFFKSRKRTKQSDAIKQLQKTLTKLRAQAFKSNISPDKLEKALQTINELQDQLSNYRPKTGVLGKKKPMEPPALKSARQKIAQLRRAMKVEDQLTDLNRQLETGDFVIKEKPPQKKLPPDLERKEVELKITRKKVRAAISEMAPPSVRGAFVETVNTGRTLKATADMSYLLRQGAFLAARRPIKATKAFGKSILAFFSNRKAEQIDMGIRSAPHHYLREKAGLHLTEVGGRVSAREEVFMSRLAEKIPLWGIVVRASDRNMVTGLNLLRTAAFDGFLKKFPNATHAELKAWADYVNVASGRGNLGSFKQAANILSLGFFAPRFAVSRIQTPFKVFRHWKNPRVRKEIARDMVAVVGAGATVLTLAKLAGFEVGYDPRDSDFGKILVGNTRIDVFAGFQQPARTIWRTGLFFTDAIGLTGEDLTDYEKDVDPIELWGRFSQYKLNPVITTPIEAARGRTIVGPKVEPLWPLSPDAHPIAETAIQSVMPMFMSDVRDAWQLEGPGRAAVVGGLTFFGVGANTYEKSRKKTKKRLK